MPHRLAVVPVWIILGIVLSLVVISLVLLLAPKGQRPPDEAWNGLFYSNRDDPALLVPKRFGIGYTLNFGHPWSWAVLAVIALGAALPFVLTAVFMRHLPR
ncbi:DUF5808 domain-containing protein [Edaphobacter bradus]|uniref:DUF5808 domain-containing protein n=1 Tax=Edaphobacter bradus TaxID=2259016 RepID=UPI0021E0C516|nr:DUF5808 domain-containing protein [Edaphobacter bradus]